MDKTYTKKQKEYIEKMITNLTIGNELEKEMMKKSRCDHRETLGSKGDMRRPTDTKKFESNWDRIFAKKKVEERKNA